MKALTFVELDIEVCSLTYGVAPCVATLAGPTPTGDRKCFNSKATCQDRPHYAASTVTLRFAEGTAYLVESGIEAIPCIEQVSLTPATVSLGEDLGTRGSLKVTFSDFPWPDTGPGYDPYLADRAYDPFKTGTYWGKFRSRQRYLRNRPIRVIRGFVGQSLAEMETRHFLVESFEGPSLDGRFSITAKDALKMADEDRALAPKLSNGFLVSAITDVATTATLSPAGVGDGEYPASGLVAIGGKEICAFTRVGDVLTLTRAQHGTEASAHDAQDRAQICLYYVGQDPAVVISDLFQIYASVPAEYIPLTEWQFETSTFLRRVYSRLIAEPTAVSKLVSAVVQQAALALWWDDRERLIRLQVLRQIPTDAVVIDETSTLTGTLKVREQPDKRASQVWTYFGLSNPLKKPDDADNYRSSAVTADLQAETDYGAAAVKRIFASWVPAFGRQVALRVNDIQLGRFRDAPRKFTFSMFRGSGEAPALGRGYRLKSRALQDDTGAMEEVPVQVVRLTPTPSGFDVEADEMRFVSLDEGDLDNRVLIVDANAFNINLRQAHDLLYPTPVSGDEVTCIIEAGVIVGSTSNTVPAFVVGDWPAGVDVYLVIRGRIQGAGGEGGRSGLINGKPGGTALHTDYPVAVDGTGGEIWGGGGGGGAWSKDHTRFRGGGGGQGYAGGLGGVGTEGDGTSGTSEAPGTYPPGNGGGAGGAAGQAGKASSTSGGVSSNAGSAGGLAIDGVSYLTITGSPSIKGSQVN